MGMTFKQWLYDNNYTDREDVDLQSEFGANELEHLHEKYSEEYGY